MLKTKEDILEQIALFSAAHGIPMGQIAVGGGAALVAMGLRKETADINLWIDDPYFQEHADRHGVTVRAWHDPVVPPDEGTVIWVRRRNRYFPTIVIGELNVFDAISLTVQKRGGLMEPARPLAKRQQDQKDLVLLNDILKEKNKVREVV